MDPKVMTGGKHARVCRVCLSPVRIGETYIRIKGRKTHVRCANHLVRKETN